MTDHHARPALSAARFPLVARIATGLFQGIARSGISADELPVFILGFFSEDELRPLRRELLDITEIAAGDKDWQSVFVKCCRTYKDLDTQNHMR